MDLSTCINAVLCVLSFILALISLIFVIISLNQNKKILEQNNKMLEGSTRPIISIYIDVITICEQVSFFVLKNFGHSPATITRFDYDPILKSTNQTSHLLNEQFDYVCGMILSPGQSKLLQYDATKLSSDTLTFVIGYDSFGKHYEDVVTMNVKNYIHIPVIRPNSHVTNENERQVQTLREITERLI